MKVVLTSKNKITSKKGDEFTIYKGISQSGETVDFLLNAADEAKYAIPKEKLISEKGLKDLFELEPVVEVSFNQRGRLENIDLS